MSTDNGSLFENRQTLLKDKKGWNR